MALAVSAGLLAGTAYVFWAATGRLALLWLIGGGLGFALYHAALGFTGAYRAAFTTGRSGAVRAQMLMLAVAVWVIVRVVIGFQAVGRGEPIRNPESWLI